MDWACREHVGYEKCVGYQILVGKLEDEGSLARPRSRWADNIKIDVWEEGQFHLVQDRDHRLTFLNAGINISLPWKA